MHFEGALMAFEVASIQCFMDNLIYFEATWTDLRQLQHLLGYRLPQCVLRLPQKILSLTQKNLRLYQWIGCWLNFPDECFRNSNRICDKCAWLKLFNYLKYPYLIPRHFPTEMWSLFTPESKSWNLCANYEKLQNKSWKSHKQVENKSWTSLG